MTTRVEDSLEYLRLRAAVVVDFALGELFTAADPDDVVVDFLNAYCHLHQTADRGPRWALADRIRSQVLCETDIAELRRMRSSLLNAPNIPLQAALDRSLSSSSFDSHQLLQTSVSEARAVFQVARWWDGTSDSVPPIDFAEWLLRKKLLFLDSRAMANDHFVYRKEALSVLRKSFLQPGAKRVFVQGPAGTGKSALLSAHLIWALDSEKSRAALLDFNDPSLDPTFVGDTVRRIIEALAIQTDYGHREWRALVDRANTVAEFDVYARDSASRPRGSDSDGWRRLLTDCVELIRVTAGRLLVILDTYEQVERRGDAAIAGFHQLIGALEAEHVQSVVAGRDLWSLDGVDARRLQLNELSPDEARELLEAVSEAKTPARDAALILKEFGYTPRAVRLAADQLLNVAETDKSTAPLGRMHGRPLREGDFSRPALREFPIDERRSYFVVAPLDPGLGYTLGNSLRRTLVSSIPGAAVTSVRIDGVLHEFTTVPGVKEDVTDIILNLKGLVLSSVEDEPVTMYLRKQGPGEVTAGDIVPPAGVTVHNPNMHIATLNDKGKLEVELVVEHGRGYVPAVQNRASGAEIGCIPVDSVYSPVLRVTYRVEATRVEQRTDFDRLVLDVETKGSITPRDALASAGKTLVELFSLTQELNVDAEGMEIGPSPAEADHIASFMLPIDDLDLTVRSYNCLKREGVHTVGELVSRTESDLLDIRNFGQKSIDEVKVKLHHLGLSLKDSPPSFDPSEVAGYHVATGTWSTQAAYDEHYAETEQQGLPSSLE